MNVTKVCKETVWLTPKYIVDRVSSEFEGDFCDPATQPDNPTGASRFYTKETDGLSNCWGGKWFLNPPYGREMKEWLRSAALRGGKGILLVPHDARSCTRYWQNDVLRDALSAICYLNRRVPFLDSSGVPWSGNPHSSQLMFFNFTPKKVDLWTEIGVLAGWSKMGG